MPYFWKLCMFETVNLEDAILCFWVCFMLYNVVLDVSMISSIRFSIYEYIWNYGLKQFSNLSFSEMTGMLNLFCFWVAPTALGLVSSCRASEANPENGIHIEGASWRYNCGSNIVFDLFEQLYKSRQVNKHIILILL